MCVRVRVCVCACVGGRDLSRRVYVFFSGWPRENGVKVGVPLSDRHTVSRTRTHFARSWIRPRLVRDKNIRFKERCLIFP